ncbi:hypothetical protein LAZ67_3001242, partial [Cordylochernes scorpioides]
MESMLDEDGCVSLEAVLKAFNAPVSEEQAWALAYETSACLAREWRKPNARLLCIEQPAHLKLHRDGWVHERSVKPRDGDLPDITNNQQKSTWKFSEKKADWSRFSNTISKQEVRRLENDVKKVERETDIDMVVDRLSDIILEAAYQSLEVKSSNFTFDTGIKWWNKELEQKKKYFHYVRNRYFHHKAISVNEYKSVRNKYKNSIRKAKRNSWRDFIEENGSNNPFGNAYRTLKKLCSSNQQKGLPIIEQAPVDSKETLIKDLINELIPDDTTISDTAHHTSIRNYTPNFTNSNSCKIHKKEIEEIIDKINNMPRHSRRLLGRNTAASRRYRNARAIETPLQSETRRALRRLRYSEARVAATQAMQVPVQRIQLWTHKPFSGLQYNAHIDYKADSSVDIGQMSRKALSLANKVLAESPGCAEEVPERTSILLPTGEELSPKEVNMKKTNEISSEIQKYANSPAGDGHANPAAARGDVTAPKTAAATSATPASPASLNWADSEMAEVDANEDFTVVKSKKRRRTSTTPEHAAKQPSRPAEKPSSQQLKRPTGPRTVPPKEIKATRANIADAKARQASTNHENYIFVELCPDIPDYSYLRAIGDLVGGPKNIAHFGRMNSHYIVGLASKNLASRLVEEGLNIEGTLLKVFPFRKRAERIIVANLPGFVEDATIVQALSQYGDITSIAPIMIKMGEFAFSDGRREAFILLHRGVRLETLPARLTIQSKGDTLSAFLSFGIKCSKCGRQGHRRASCPSLARQGNGSPRQAASPIGARPPPPPPPPPQQPRKPAPAPATPASPVQPAKTTTESPAIPSASHPAEPMDLAQPAHAALPAPLAVPRPLEPRISPLDHEMSVEKLTSPSSTPARGKAALEQLLEHLGKSPNISIDWDKLPDLNREEAQKLLTSETTMKRRASTLTPAQVKALNKLHDTIKPLCPDSNSTIRKTLQKTRKETNAFHLGSGQDLCLGYSAVVLAHPVAISGSGLACVFGPGVAVLHQRILWPGHIALATIDVRGEEMTAIAVHLAHEPRERNRQLELLAATAAQEEEGACWIIGDFNIRDRGPSSSSSSDALAALLDLAALVDVATQFDAAHLPTRVAMHGDQVESNRLDRILVPAGVLDRASIYATSHYHLSDHRLVLLQVGPPTTAVSSPTQPRLAAMLRSGLALEHLAGYIRELEEDTAHDDDDGTFWDRWTSIKAGLLAEARSLHDPRHAASDSYVYRARRYIAAQLEASSIRADYPSLPDLARAIRLRRPVSVIRDEEDNVIEGPELRRRAFATFQPRFARPTSDPAAGAAFIASSAPTTRELSEEDPLQRPDISPSEIAHAIEHLPRGKAPGWDGLPCELLVAFNEDFFAEALALVFVASRLRGALPPSTRRSSICLVPKARGGRGLDGYRPVALPSADYRVLAAILHRRLKPHLRTLVPECQTYAVPGRSPSWNIAMVTDAIEEATALGSPLAVMGVDLESAFDSLDRGFLESLLTSLRLPPAFMAWINILYAGADATIRAGGFHTTAFPLLNGLRQGCAVSAALFSIATGPLLRRLELTLGVGNVIAYADDIVLLFHRDGDFERVATVFEEYKQASGVGVNLRKSAGLWCGAWRNRGDSPLGASWSTTSIRVLGLDIAPRSTVAHREQHLLALLENACRKWTPFTRGLSLVGRARAANTLVGSVIQHYLHGYLPSPPTIAKLQARLARFVWGQDHTAWLPADVMARPVAIGGLGLLDLATQLQLACLKGVQVALRGGRNAFSWLVESGEAWIHPPPDGTRLQPRRLRLLKLWEEASNILGLNLLAVPTAQLLDLNIIGGCRFLRPPDLLAPARWRGARVRDLLAEGHLTARPTRSALADAAALGAFCRRLTSENAVGFGAESAPSSSSLAAAVVLRGTATPFLNGLTTRSARRALDRPRLAATPISRFTSRWSPTIGPLPSRIDWASLRRCAYSGHEADAALKLALHALPHPAHPASVGPSCPACGSIDRSLGHRYWCCRSIRPLIREAFNIIGRPPDLQAWIFGGSGLEDDALSILASAKLRIYRYFVQSLNLSLEATNLVWADSPFNADELPARYGLIPQTSAELSANNNFQLQNSEETQEMASYANLPIGQRHANSASTRESATTLPSSGVFLGQQNRDNLPMDLNPVTEGDFTIVQNKRKRRDTTAPRDMTAQPNSAGSAARRQRSSPALIPRVQEIRTTRTHIAEARARQANCTEEQCFFLEYCPSYETYQYLRAIGGIIGGTKNIVQFSKVNGQYLVGLTSRSMAEQLIREGLEIEGTLLRTFPFRRSATRITIGNLPFFVRDAVVIDALARFGRVTSIAPKQLKAGEFEFTDGRREAFILLHDGITVDKLPTRFEIKIKGEAWPAYISYGIKCSRCHGQGHRRASCPLLYGQSTTSRRASPPSTTGLPPSTAPGLPRQSSAAPSAPAPPSPALGPSGAQPDAQAVSPPSAAPRPTAPAPPASSVHVAAPAPPPEAPTPEHPAGPRSATTEPTPPARPDFTAPCGPLPAQGTLGPATHTPDVDMTTTEEPSAPPPSAVSTPPLPTPQPARPTPPVPHGKESAPTKVASPPALPVKTDEDRKRWLLDTFKDLNYRAILRPIMVWSDDNTLINSVLCYEKAWNSYHNFKLSKLSHTHTHTLGRAAALFRAPPFSPLKSGKLSLEATNLVWADSPFNADELPARYGLIPQTSAELSAENYFQLQNSEEMQEMASYANLPTGERHANSATTRDSATALPSSGVILGQQKRKTLPMDQNPVTEDDYTIVQNKRKRRDTAAPRVTTAQPNSAGTAARRQRSSPALIPRVQEIRTTRTHIAEARARQATCTEEQCFFLEYCPGYETYQYLRAIGGIVGGTKNIIQFSKVNGQYLVGLTSRSMVEQLIREGLEVEGTLLRTFPFRRSATRITIGNLPFFVRDAVVIDALARFGRVTSIAPKQLKVGEFDFTDGRREAFILLHDGITVEKLPTRFDIKIMGEAWPAYITYGIKCSRCHGQGHRRASCPLLHGQSTTSRRASPPSTTGLPPSTAPGLPGPSPAAPTPPAPTSPAIRLSGAQPDARAVSPPSTAPRPTTPAPPASSVHVAAPAPPPEAPAPEHPASPRSAATEPTPPARPDFTTPCGPLPAQGTLGPATHTPDDDMITTEETSASSPAAVISTLPLPAPQPAGPIPPAPDEEEMTPIMREECMVIEILKKLKHLTCLRPLYQSGIQPNDLKDAILFIDERESLMARLTPAMRGVLAEFLSAAIEPARGKHPDSNYSNNQEAFDKYANLPAGGKDVNLAAPFNLAANPSSNAVAQAQRNWADMTEDINPEIEDNFTLVQRRKRRRGSENSPTANAPSSNVGSSRTDRRPRSSTGWAPRAEEIRTTRAHIAEARAQQASSSEEYCVYIERSPDLEPFHYLRALDRMVGGTGGFVQVSKVNGLYLLGLTNRGLVERLISEGLEVEGTLLKAFPFRKRAERITVGNLPFFVADSVIINALSTFGRVTSIAPKLMKAGPYIYNDGRREAFIALHEGVTIERLPTRLDIKIKGETWPAYLTSGIRMAPPTTPAGVPPPTTPAPPQRSAAQPPAPASSDPASETPGAPPEARAVTTSTAPRPSPPVAPAVPMEKAPSAPPPVTPAPSLQAPEGPVGPRPANSQHPEPPPARPDFVAPRGPLPAQKTLGPAAPTPDVEMSTTEEPSAPSPAAVSAPPLPAPQPAGPTPSAPHKEDPTPAMTPPSLPPTPMEEDLPPNLGDCIDEILREIIMSKINPGPLVDDETSWIDAIDAILHPHSRAPFLARLSPILKKNYAVFFEAAIERARDSHPRILSGLSELRRALAPKTRQSPGCAEKVPERPSILLPTGEEISPKEINMKKTKEISSENQKYANSPAGDMHVNPAAARGDVTAPKTAATTSVTPASPASLNWADSEMAEVDANEGYTVVKRKKRRLVSPSPDHASKQPSRLAEKRSSQQQKRPTGPRSMPPQEIKATRANIADAKARQTSTNHENYVFVELCPDIPDYSYLRAIGHLLGGPGKISQFNRMNGHYVVGLASKDHASRLVEVGLDIEGTHLKVFPFRKRAERITIANLPGFVEDSAIVEPLRNFGTVTSIAPIMIKMGEYTFNDGRREAFILLREGVRLESLPTRLTIKSKGDTLSAFLSFGIKCSKCGKQGHRRANCPALARQGNGSPRQAASHTDARPRPPPPPPPPQQPRKPAPAPATPASPVQPAKTSTEAPAIPSAPHPAEPKDLAQPAPVALPAPLAAPRPPEPETFPLDIEMSEEELTSTPSASPRGKPAFVQLQEHLKQFPNLSIDWDRLPGIDREDAQRLLTSKGKMEKRVASLSKAQETNAFHLGSGQDLCLGYSAVVLAHPVAISGSGLACVFGPGVAVLHQRILWPGHIALATIDVRGEMTAIVVHLAHEPRERNRQLELLAATAAQEEEGACWIIGDFNIRDRGPSSSSSSDALAALLDLAALVDVATQFDAAHLPTRVAMHGDQVESNRLDRILVPAGVLDRASIYATSHYHLSDHRLVLLQVGPPTTAVSSPTQPRLAAMLRSGLALEHLAGYIRELEEDTAHDDDDGTFWDRWTSIKAGLLAEARSLHDPRHAASDSYVYRARRYIAAQLEASSIRADYPSLPDLARAIRLRRPFSVIRDEQDNIIEGPELRRKAFATFQPRFARPTSDPAAGAAFIASSAPTTTRDLSEEDPLHRPDISPSEIANAIEHLPRGKAPGWDGLPCELLVAFSEDFFAEALARVFAASRLRGALPPSTRRSSICLVPKARGGRGLNGYRPVALPSADYRVLAAILHRRLKPHLRTLVPECQTYAVPGRSPSWNIAMVTDAVEEATALGSPLAVMGVDLESAFDSLDRGFLESLLISLRLPPAFLAWINILYAGADATIRAGGFYTTAFPLLNGLRQGCAVSAALFSIATGPLLRRLELTLGVGNVTAYADDIVLLFHRDEDFERVATVFEDYKQASGVGVNLRKSAGLWCGAWRNRGDSPLGASWSTTSIRVLGLDIAPRSTVIHREQHLLALLETACRKWTPFTRGLSLVGRARAANTLVGSTIQHHLHGYLPSPPTIAKLQARLARFVWGQDHTAWLPADVMARPVAIGGLGLLDLATQLQLACLKGVQAALRGGRNAFSWLVESGEAWIHPPPDGTRLQPRRLRLLKLWEEASNILGLNHRAVPTAQLLDLNIIGGCRFLRPPDLLAPARWSGARVRDLIEEEHLIARPTRSALADAAALGAFCRRLTSENAVGFGAESAPSSSSLAAAVVLRGTATPFLNGLTTRSARRALDRPRLAATPISRFLARWTPTINPPSRIDWASLRRCAYSGHEADAALKLALHALPHPAHPASVGPSCPACGSIDRSLGHRYWCCRSIRPLIREAFNIIGRPPDLQAWIFGGSGLEDDALSILASAKLRIYRYFVQVGLGEAVEDPLIAWSRTLQRRESPGCADKVPERPSILLPTGEELSPKDINMKKIIEISSENQKYANSPAGDLHVNPAAARGDVTAPKTAATTSATLASPASLNWADSEMAEADADEGYTVVKRKKRRLVSPSPDHAAKQPSRPADKRGSQQQKRPTGPRSMPPQEIKATRANIADAKARQNSTNHENYIFVELCPDIPDYYYLQAIGNLVGGPRKITQFNRMNGHYVVGLAGKDLASRLVEVGLDIEGTHLKVFPYRKRAERIIIANLPGFVEDSAIVEPLRNFGTVTSIAPIMIKMGEYTFNDGRREAFILLREGVRLESLPTRLTIKSKGDTLSAFLSFGIKCSKCGKHGHRRANCPALARQGNGSPRQAASPTDARPRPPPPPPQQPRKPAPAPATPASPVQPAKSSTEAPVTPSAHHPAEPRDLAQPAPVALPAPLTAPRPPEPETFPLDIEMSEEELTSTPSASPRGKPAFVQLQEHLKQFPNLSIDWDGLPGIDREDAQRLLTSKGKLEKRAPSLSKAQETNAFHLGSGQDLCLGYSAVVLAHPVAISGSGLACVFGPGVAVLHQRILWPGHIALATIDVRGEEMTAIAVHLAHEPRERNRQLELLAATAAQEEEGACWIIGDFNIRDRGPSSSSSSDALAALLDLAALVDVATQFDAAHLPTRVAMHGDQVESNRLDRILVPAGVLDRASIYATSHYHLSDHRLVLLQVGPPTTAVSSPTQPRLAAMLRSGLALEHLAGYIRELEEDTAHDDDDGTFWDRWTSIKAGLLAEARSLHDPRHAASDSYVYRARRYIAAQLEASSIRADYPSLPDLARAIRLRRPVSVIRDEQDNIIEGPELRRRAFATFQPRFARPTSDPAAGAAFIASSAPTTTRELSEEDPLHRPDISPSEIANAIEHLPRGKAPGWDGLPCELLIAFSEDFFAEALARVFAASRLRGALPPSTRRSSICLVPKARGGRGLDGYRPVALPSADYRVLAAILHRRLKPHLRTLVPECQTYAVPGRSPSWNIAMVTDAVEEATALGSPLAVMGVDLESAFDSLDRGFLESLLTSLRLPPAFRAWINILYAGADATIRAGGFYTTAFPLLNGLRQGCAVSAALFSIATGPLLRRLELTLGVGNVIAYADDIVLLFHRDGDFERVATVFEEYKQASGVSVNLRKSAGLWCGAWRNRGDSPLGASWSTTSIRVLGLDIAPRSTVAHREQHLLALLETACRKWTPFTRGLSLVGRARAANTLVGSVIQHHLHGYLPSPPTIAKLQARLARFVWGQDHTAWLPADVMARPVAIGGLGLLDLATQLQLACLKGVQVALRGGRNAFSWLVSSNSGEAWIHPPPDGTRLQPRRLRLLKLWEEASNILGLNHRAVPTAQLLDLPIIGGCRFLRPPDLLAPARWSGARIRDLIEEEHLIARPTRSALTDAAALSAFCRRLTSENAVGFGAESAPSSSSLAAAVVLRGTATPFLNGLTTRSARRALDRPRLAATPISRFLARWTPTINPPSRIDWASLRSCAYSGHEADAALKLALHALPHPAHPASVGPSCPACGSIDRSLGHRYWCCRSIRPLIREAFNIIGRPPDLQAWIFGGSGLEDDALSILASAKLRIYRYFVQ